MQKKVQTQYKQSFTESHKYLRLVHTQYMHNLYVLELQGKGHVGKPVVLHFAKRQTCQYFASQIMKQGKATKFNSQHMP